MALDVAATPLMALDAVVIDTETTGLDSSKARIVQIGAVAIRGGAVLRDESFVSLVRPDGPIPLATTAIHGISNDDVRNAPSFDQVRVPFQTFVGSRVVIGHNVGFDLAMFRREHSLLGLVWEKPRALDTRLLAELCFPGLSGYTLDHVLAQLDIPAADRHDALADSIVTGQVFLALVPHLRKRGIRTLSEAEQACRVLGKAIEDYRRAGWVEPVVGPTAGELALGRIDSYPFRHRIRDVMTPNPVVVPGTMSVHEVARLMIDKRISSVFVATDRTTVSVTEAGIVTERDVMRAIAASGAAALGAPIDQLASRPLAAVPAHAFVYRAIGRMGRRKIRHLAVAEEDGRLVGVVTSRDLLRFRTTDALMLGDAIDTARDTAALAAAWAKIAEAVRCLLDEGVSARDVAAVVSHEIGALTRTAARLAERRMKSDGFGPPPVPYAVLVLGSAGRGESLLAPDQDNAIVFADTEDEATADAWFARHGAMMADCLNEVGIPYCTGGVMAKNAAFRGSSSTWRARIAEWVGRTRPEDLLNVDIFFDFRSAHGEHALAAGLRRDAQRAAAHSPMLAKLLAAGIETFQPPLGFLGGFKLENGRMDLKRGGLFPIVAAARCLALRHDVAEVSTPGRLRAIRALKIGGDQNLEEMDRSHALIVSVLLRQQVLDIAAGRPPSNKIDPAILSRRDAADLKRALSGLTNVATTVRDLLFRA
jgi:DNA polymerase-3 subunit epsilon/CBS domain-containing protein